MKKLIVFILMCMLDVSLYSQQYYWMQTYPNNYSLHDISSYNETECYVLGRRLNSIVIIKSDTLGQNWKVITDSYQNDRELGIIPPFSFRISNPYKNYIFIGREKYEIIKSSDGGLTFDTIKVKPLNPDHNKDPMDYIRGLSMADTNVGIASTNIYLFITKDGWKTYETHSTLDLDIPDEFVIRYGDNFSNNVYAIDKDNFISNVLIIKQISKSEYIRTTGTVRTTDGGKTWNLATLSYLKEDNEPTNYISSFYFHDNNNGWGVGYRSNEFDSTGSKYKSVIFKTTDGGFTWQNNFEVSAGKVGAIFLQIAFRDYKRGVVVGKYGRQFYTTDGGDTWIDESRTDPNTRSSRTVQQVTFMGNLPIISTIYDGIYSAMKYHKTTDVHSEFPNDYNGLIFPNPA
ncbi:MAG: hypothetical protein KIT33_01480, partial [Candidatus Kapabacteria bacterium]|nr:hypothetical protein [Candidatus Kapabacteria bacterium]